VKSDKVYNFVVSVKNIATTIVHTVEYMSVSLELEPSLWYSKCMDRNIIRSRLDYILILESRLSPVFVLSVAVWPPGKRSFYWYWLFFLLLVASVVLAFFY